MMNWRTYQAQQRVIEIADRFLSYLDEGEGPPVVLLHGIPTWGYLWAGLLRVLSRECRVLIPDLLGFGYSDKSDRFERGLDRQAEAICAWMDRLGVPRATVVGHDIGGGVALRLAVFSAERVERLALLNTVCYDSWPIEAMLQFGHPEAKRRVSAATARFLLKQALKRGMATSQPAEVFDGLLAPYATEVGKLSLVRNAVALDTNLTMTLTPYLAGVRIPTLVLWGEEDVFQPVTYGERLAKDLGAARLVRVPGARHFVMLDQPEVVSERLLAFLADRSAAARAAS
ncbi:alpha/beta fold hydrolase [Candidatus Nitrospira bockiana]